MRPDEVWNLMVLGETPPDNYYEVPPSLMPEEYHPPHRDYICINSKIPLTEDFKRDVVFVINGMVRGFQEGRAHIIGQMG